MSGTNEEQLITSIGDLPRHLASSVSEAEAAYIDSLKSRGRLPFAVTPYYASLAGADRDDPIRRQFFPDPREERVLDYELDDPLGEACHRPLPRLVHQYGDRVLLLSNGNCAGYCRFCFRRIWMGKQEAFIGERELDPILGYLKKHTEIREILVSGGDPLQGTDEKLRRLLESLRGTEGEKGAGRTAGMRADGTGTEFPRLLRIGTRIPVTRPSRITGELVQILAALRPLRLVVHLNHPRELAPEVRAALSSCVTAGIPVHSQTVLLKGINDDPAVLAELFRDCLSTGITPYYLFQGDLAPGTSHFRVPLERGLEIYHELCPRISALGLPAYAVDLPGGGGKIRLHDGVIAEKGRDAGGHDVYYLKDRNAKPWPYPAE